ncbi:MAG: hypothetical protein JKX94_09695, partial [Sneathiella sp.]|nr:hypothetical protein [Sneathiella sp.]
MRFTGKIRLYTCAIVLSAAMAVGLPLQSATAAVLHVDGIAANLVDKTAGTTHQLNAVSGGSIQDISVSISLRPSGINSRFTWWKELDIFIVHNATEVQLFLGSEDFGDGTFDVTFNDNAPRLIPFDTDNVSGTYLPEVGSLSSFFGQEFAGLW